MSYMKLLMTYTISYISVVSWTSNNWLMIWFLMEVTLVTFLGLMTLGMGYGVTEVMMKYFIVQAFISLLLLMFLLACLFNLMFMNNMMILSFLMIKVGMFPFHSWLILILGKLDWLVFAIMSGPMKLVPLSMMYFMLSYSSLFIVAIGSLVVGSLGGLNNSSIQKMLGYSSMINMCWMIYSLSLSFFVFGLYFGGYYLMLIWLSLLFKASNIYYVSQFKLLGNCLISKLTMFFYGLSISGFPPFLGFLIKWVVVSGVWFTNLKFLISIMILFSFLATFFYLQLFFFVMLIFSNWVKWWSLKVPLLGFTSFILLTSYLVIFIFY